MTEAGTPVGGSLADDLARLHADPLNGVGVPGELFLGSAAAAPALPAAPPKAPPREGGGPLTAIAAGVRDGKRSTVREVAEALERIRTFDGEVRAWVCTDPTAQEASRRADDEVVAGRWRGPLHGVPVGIKDIVDVAGLPTGAGSRHRTGPGRESIAGADAAVVGLLRSAGAVVVGKTTTHEFAFGGTTPPTRNPHDLSRIPGGSSGGSAAAVAAGHVPLAIGTDTCGSVRIPSAYCGVAGVLPSVGVLPRDGVVPLAWSLDRVGLIAATAADLDLASSALGMPGREPGPDPLAGLRVGIPPGTLDEPLEPAVAAAFDAVLALLRAAGADVGSVPVEHAWAAVPAGIAIFLAEGMDHHRARWTRAPELFGADVRATLAMAEQISGADYVRAQRVRAALRTETLAALSSVDLLLTPAMPNAAPLVEQATAGVVVIDGREISLAEAHLRFNVLANLAALPSGTQPVGVDAERLPVGVQWVAAPGADRHLVAVMAALEAALGPFTAGAAG